MTLRQHLEAYERQTGESHPMLADGPVLPAGCGQLWKDFLRLHVDRQRGMSPMPITSRDILDWQALEGVALASWEVDAIRAADGEFFKARAE